jgi:hypothetical protein
MYFNDDLYLESEQCHLFHQLLYAPSFVPYKF